MDCGFCRSFAAGFRACGAWAKTWKGRPDSSGRYPLVQGIKEEPTTRQNARRGFLLRAGIGIVIKAGGEQRRTEVARACCTHGV